MLERHLPGSVVWVGHFDDDRGLLRVLDARGERSLRLEAGAEAPLETSLCHVMARAGGGNLVGDAANDAA